MVLIFDTDPGVDDMLALLLLLSAAPTDSELRLISLTYGNCSLRDTLNNTLSMFNVIAKENKWRKSQNLAPFTTQRPAVHLGASRALTGESRPDEQEEAGLLEANEVDATDVHGSDGLAGVHALAPEFDAPSEWFKLFDKDEPIKDDPALPFVAGGGVPAWKAILDVIRAEPEDTVTIVAVGPLTNVALAAEKDPKLFSRVKQVLSMGGALRHEGNVTPLAEFNVYADALAAARVYALTSRNPSVVMPANTSRAMWENAQRPLRLVIFPLDITEKHDLYKSHVEEIIGGAQRRHPDSILAQWILVWLNASFANYGRLIGVGPDNASCHLHDPLTAAYGLALDASKWEEHTEDVRVEYEGQWCKGLTVVDNRGRARSKHNPHDLQKWLTEGEGNNVTVVTKSPFMKNFHEVLLTRIVGL